MNKKNYLAAFLAGFITGILLIPTFKNLGIQIPYIEVLLIVFWPLLFIFGIWFAGFIGRRYVWFWQLAKFAEVGFLNTAIDFGILNFLIFISDIPSGVYFSVFKAVSFIIANINSFFWNRFWVFAPKNTKDESYGKEYAQFFLVSLVAIVINVGTASLIVNLIPIQLGLTPALWANVGAAVGVAAGLFWNFFGYKFIVFKN